MNIDLFISEKDKKNFKLIEENFDYISEFKKSIDFKYGRKKLKERFSFLRLSEEKTRLYQLYFRGREDVPFSLLPKVNYKYGVFEEYVRRKNYFICIREIKSRTGIDPTTTRSCIFYYWGKHKNELMKKIKDWEASSYSD
jgi:hypothetical protein